VSWISSTYRQRITQFFIREVVHEKVARFKAVAREQADLETAISQANILSVHLANLMEVSMSLWTTCYKVNGRWVTAWPDPDKDNFAYVYGYIVKRGGIPPIYY
jgi:hypothetical protein